MVGLSQQTTWCKARMCAQKPQTDSDSYFSVFLFGFFNALMERYIFKRHLLQFHLSMSHLLLLSYTQVSYIGLILLICKIFF